MEEKDEKFIIDSAHLYPVDIMKYIDLNKWDVYCVAYPNIDANKKLSLIRKYDNSSIRKYDNSSDWTYNKTDEEMINIIKELIKISKELELQSKKLGINFIDASDYNTIEDLTINYYS